MPYATHNRRPRIDQPADYYVPTHVTLQVMVKLDTATKTRPAKLGDTNRAKLADWHVPFSRSHVNDTRSQHI